MAIQINVTRISILSKNHIQVALLSGGKEDRHCKHSIHSPVVLEAFSAMTRVS